MKLESLKTLFRQWREKQLERDRAIGQMLQHLIEVEQRLQRLEQERSSGGANRKLRR